MTPELAWGLIGFGFGFSLGVFVMLVRITRVHFD